MKLLNPLPRTYYSSLFVIFVLYVLLLALYAVKTVYYYNNNSMAWWGYCVLLTVSFLYFFYYCFSSGPHWLLLLLFFSFFLGYIPFEVSLPWVVELISGDEKIMSGLAEKFPYGLGVLIDVLFYPVLIFVLLFSGKIATARLQK